MAKIIFTPVCHSVHRGGSTPGVFWTGGFWSRGVSARGGVWSGGCLLRGCLLGSMPPKIFFQFFLKIFFFDFFFILIFYFFWGYPPPPKLTRAYGQWAVGTYPTGMHSCCNEKCIYLSENEVWSFEMKKVKPSRNDEPSLITFQQNLTNLYLNC